MALHNMAGMDTATTGTGTITLGSALTGLQTFATAGAVDGEQLYYSIKDGVEFEVGSGTYTVSGTTLSRDTVYDSSNAGAKINVSGSGVEVRIVILSQAMTSLDTAVIDHIDQSGGTGDTYSVLSGAINGSNTTFTVSTGMYFSGSLSVYLNGQLQTQGSGEDWVETNPSAGTFDFITAPVVGNEITVISGGGAINLTGYSTIDISGGTLGGAVNSSNTDFTTSLPYLTGHLLVFRNGQLLTVVDDWTETSPSAGTFSITIPPTTGDVITAISGVSGTLVTSSPAFLVYMNSNFT